MASVNINALNLPFQREMKPYYLIALLLIGENLSYQKIVFTKSIFFSILNQKYFQYFLLIILKGLHCNETDDGRKGGKVKSFVKI